MELVFADRHTWCDFCSLGEKVRQQMRLAIPLDLVLLCLVLLYGPALIRSIRDGVARHRRFVEN